MQDISQEAERGLGTFNKLFIVTIDHVQVDSAWSAGNYAEAERSARIARTLNIVGFGVGIGTWVVAGIVVVANVVALSVG